MRSACAGQREAQHLRGVGKLSNELDPLPHPGESAVGRAGPAGVARELDQGPRLGSDLPYAGAP